MILLQYCEVALKNDLFLLQYIYIPFQINVIHSYENIVIELDFKFLTIPW